MNNIKFSIFIYIVIINSFFTHCVMAHNSKMFKNPVLNSELENCVNFEYTFDEENQYYYGIGVNEIEDTATFYSNILKGVKLSISENNEKCNKLNIEELIIKIKIREQQEPYNSGYNVINLSFKFITLFILPLYLDYTYDIEYITKSYSLKTTRNFLLSYHSLNILLFFRYREPFLEDFKEITNEFLINYHDYHKGKAF